MTSSTLTIIILLYLALIFLIAYWGEKLKRSRIVNSPYIYTLSLAVFCSAWTYYGSVGKAATNGIEFIAIYLGPVIVMPLWVVIMRKILKISKHDKVSSIADFISLRYGKNRMLGAVVTIVCLLATIPYISLQLKAISDTFRIFISSTETSSKNVLFDSTFYVALILALFATFFGTQRSDATEKHKGIVASVAFESAIKLLFFLVIGVFVTFGLFDGPSDIIEQASLQENYQKLIRFGSVEYGYNWILLMLLSAFSIFLLPRQFHISVVENSREKHIKTAIWLFPLYLLLFNVFVLYLALGGNLLMDEGTNAEYYTLLIPLSENQTVLSLLVFLGGFSAVISMVVISTLALSNMVTTNLIIPYGFLSRFIKSQSDSNHKSIKNIRRISIFIIIAIAYAFYASFSIQMPLISIGLVAFVMVAQLAPSFFLGLFWRRGTAAASVAGIIVGVLVATYSLILPFSMEAISGENIFAESGPFGVQMLHPNKLFGIDFLDPTPHAFFWSMFFNLFTYLIVSLMMKGNYRERNFAELFVDPKNYDNLQDNALIWKGEAYVKDIRKVLLKFLGEQRTNRALDLFFKKYKIPSDAQMADSRLINFSEQLLAGSIGSASAQILISNVVKEEEISLTELLRILEESKQNIESNKLLKDKSDELTRITEQLQKANLELTNKDKQKDEFLDTVAHELKTPITGIKASAELLIDEIDEMPEEIKAQFLSNILNDSERLARLINNILDYEKLSTGREQIEMKRNDLKQTMKKVYASLKPVADKRSCSLILKNEDNTILNYDEDRIIQVVTNLVSNALKFADPENGRIEISFKQHKEAIYVQVDDNGTGVSDHDRAYIFDKFYQSNEQNRIKKVGSGFGLAICKQIIDKHQGNIWYENSHLGGARLTFSLPVKNTNTNER